MADADGREARARFGEKGSNWFARPTSPTERAWRADLALLDAQHRRLRAAVAKLSRAALGRKPAGQQAHDGDTLVYGVASHDVYHTGQIQMLKRLWRDRKKSR